MAGGDVGNTRGLDQTPTWAVACVCVAIIIISLLLEKILHKVGTWLTEKHKIAMYEALEKVKTELMILGFISLILVFCQNYIAKICVPAVVADSMLPCPAKDKTVDNHRRLLSYEHRILAEAGPLPSCKEGHVTLISVNGLHQLHILVFFLAVFHVFYSFVTMGLGRLKTRGWKEWEQETSSQHYEFTNDPSRFRLTHETSFVRAHTSSWTRIPFLFYIGCFFRQFFRSVTKSDYLTLRHGFINVHLAPGTKFNFRKYIRRSLEEDFKTIVGVSPVLWGSFVIFLLLNVNGWKTLLWSSLIPLIIILAVGTELQSILTKMAVEIRERHAVVQGIPLVQGSDKYFWFGRPRLLLHFIHFALFQNSLQVVYFLWIWYSFGLKSCFHNDFELVIAKLILGLGVLVLCSYITLPLYALINQMGSDMKQAIFDEQTTKAIKNWHMTVKKKQKRGKSTLGGKGSTSSVSSTINAALHRFRTTGHSTYDYQERDEVHELVTDDSSPPGDELAINVDDRMETELDDLHYDDQETMNEDDFSFTKLARHQF